MLRDEGGVGEHWNHLWVQMMGARSETGPLGLADHHRPREGLSVYLYGPLWEMTLIWMKEFAQVEPVSLAHLHPSTIQQVHGTC